MITYILYGVVAAQSLAGYFLWRMYNSKAALVVKQNDQISTQFKSILLLKKLIDAREMELRNERRKRAEAMSADDLATELSRMFSGPK